MFPFSKTDLSVFNSKYKNKHILLEFIVLLFVIFSIIIELVYKLIKITND